MKKENIGKICFLKTVKLEKTYHSSFPLKEDYLPFIITGVIRGGYLIQEFNTKNVFKVKTKDIYFEKNG